MDGEFIGPKSESKENFLKKCYFFRRARNTPLRNWITDHKDKYSEAEKVGCGMNNLTNTFRLFMNGKFTEDQRRWVLSPPVSGEYACVGMQLRFCGFGSIHD
jgi:hypothetical protein